jgi:plastocyanin
MIRRALPVAILALGSLLVVGACGGDDDASANGTTDETETSLPDGPSFEVLAGEMYLKPKELTVPAGTVVLRYVNEGRLPHTLLIDDGPKFKLEVDKRGDEDTGGVTLEPGRYTLYCDVPGHKNAGMKSTLVVN